MASGDNGPRDYIRRRKGSGNYYLRLQYPDGLREVAELLYARPVRKEEETSLKTSVYEEAAVRAGPAILRHKELLLVHKALLDRDRHCGNIVETFDMTPGTRQLEPDGTQIVATHKEITTIAPDGTITSRENERIVEVQIFDHTIPMEARRDLNRVRARTKPGQIDIDQEQVKKYIAEMKRRGKLQRPDDEPTILRTLAEFKAINGGLPIIHSEPKHVDQLIEFMLEERTPSLSPGRTRKLVAYMRAAVNHSMAANRATPIYRYNIFDNFYVPEADEDGDAARPPYDEEDVAMIKAGLTSFNDEQALMLVWHISSSIRPGGIYSINSDEMEEGQSSESDERFLTRHARIRKDKNKFGVRNLPIPQPVLDLGVLPNRIGGPLFTTPLPTLLKEINGKLRRMGVNEDRKSLYSGRHRAKDRLLARDAHEQMRKAIMGHTRRIEAHDRYGTGYPMWKMKPWIDRIGF